jgi:hypothetical protein
MGQPGPLGKSMMLVQVWVPTQEDAEEIKSLAEMRDRAAVSNTNIET